MGKWRGGLGEYSGRVVRIAQSLPVASVDTTGAPEVRGMRDTTVKTGTATIRALCVVAAGTAAALTGCQVDVGGQTLPSAYYLQDDIQYFPAGPEFKLSKEAAAQKAYKKEMGDRCGAGAGGGGCGCPKCR